MPFSATEKRGWSWLQARSGEVGGAGGRPLLGNDRQWRSLPPNLKRYRYIRVAIAKPLLIIFFGCLHLQILKSSYTFGFSTRWWIRRYFFFNFKTISGLRVLGRFLKKGLFLSPWLANSVLIVTDQYFNSEHYWKSVQFLNGEKCSITQYISGE